MLTCSHEAWVVKRSLDSVEQRVLFNIHGRAVASQVANAWGKIEIVGQGDAMALGNLQDFVLAVTVESSPLKSCVDLAFGARSTPIEGRGVTSVTHNELTAFMMAWETDDKRAKLGIRTRGVDMGLEKAGRCAVYLAKISTKDIPCNVCPGC